MILIIIQE